MIIMGLRIANNIAALNSYRNLNKTDKAMSGSLEKLSSGFRINKAADDAAGLSVSENLRSQIGGLTVASRNAQDAVNVAQTADGALTESTAILQRMRDLAVQAANGGSQDTVAQGAANTEFTQLSSELTRISATTKFGTQSLLSGSYNGTFQVGAFSTSNDQISLDLTSSGSALSGSGITGFSASGLGVGSLTLSSGSTVAAGVAAAQSAISALDVALQGVSTARATIGALQNRFEHTIDSLNTSVENLSASESRIRDTDMAAEMTKFTKNQILTQAGTSMLSQANSASQNVLSLLRG
jgi:flagellin